MFVMKVHSTDMGDIVAACDSRLIGEIIEQDGFVLDLSGSFYDGEESSGEEILEAIEGCHSATIVGNSIAGFLIEEGVLDKDNVKTIASTSYAMIFRI